MSTQFTTEDVDTLTKWNALLAGVDCPCCEMPECPAVVKECESETVRSVCSDDDYTDAVAAWEADRAEWVAGEEGRLPGEYPIPAPEEPEDYDDYSHGCFLPFLEPAGDPDADLPLIYQRMKDESDSEWFYSTAIAKSMQTNTDFGIFGGDPTSYDSFYDTQYVLFVDGRAIDYLQYGGAAIYYGDVEGEDQICHPRQPSDPDDDSVIFGVGPEDLFATFSWTDAGDHETWSCTATTRKYGQHQTYQAGSSFNDPTCGAAPWGDTEQVHYDLDRQKTTTNDTLSQGITKEDLIARATGKLADEWMENGSCEAMLDVQWPTIGEAVAYLLADLEVDHWPNCGENLGAPFNSPPAAATVTKVRYQWTVPASHTGTSYKVMWDVIEEPSGWDDEEPTVFRSWVSQDNEWTWIGPAFTPSAWYKINPPSVPGTRRIVNIRCWNHHGGPFGNLPTLVGEQVTL